MIKRFVGAFALLCALAGAACAQNTSTFGNISAGSASCGGANCVYYQLPPGTPWVVVNIAGAWSGTIEIASISAPNANYSNLNSVTWQNLGTETANGSYTAATTGAAYLLVLGTSWTSGTASVTMTSSPQMSPLINPLLPGTTTSSALKLNGCAAGTYALADGSGCGPGGSGTPAGSTGQVQYNAGTAFGAIPNSAVSGAGVVTLPGVIASANNVVNVMAPPYNAACNLQQFSGNLSSAGGSIAASSAVLTYTSSVFTPAMVGETAVVWNAGAAQTNGSIGPLVTTVLSYQSGTQITLNANATTAVAYGPFEIGTLDTTSIQTAYNAAALSNQSLLFPANAGQSCLTGTIDLSAGGTVSAPATRRGQGSVVSSITGLPGQDIFQWPDGKKMNSAYQHLEGLQLVVDASLDVSSATGGAGQIWNPCNYSAGACTTPGYTTTASRVTGQCANGSGGLTACSPAISPGPVAFLGGSLSVSSDTTCDELTIPTYGDWFDQIPSWSLVGMPISIPSISITGTITAFISRTQVLVSPAYGGTCSSATGLTGTWGTPTTPPWYVGNVAEAIPASAGANAGAYQGIVDDVWITQQVGTAQFANHAGGFFFQQVPYYAKFSRITIQNLYYGYIEAIPASGNQITWAPDTSHYFDISINTFIPLVQYAGNHRILDGVSIYSANHPLSLGPFFLNAALNGAGDSTVTHFYAECWGATYGGGQFGNTGENQRWSGSQWTFSGGSPTQCNGPYVNWQASQSFVDAAIIGGPDSPTAATAGLQLGGNSNVFNELVLSQTGNVNDTGLGNEVYASMGAGTRIFAGNHAQRPIGVMDGTYLSMNPTTPYTSSSDLFTRCADWQFTYHGTSGTCKPDANYLTDGNVGGWAWTTTSTSGYTQISFLPIGSIFSNPYGSMTVGNRLPQGNVYLVVDALSATAATLSMKVYDATTGSVLLTTCNYTLTSSYAIHGASGTSDACLVNLSAVSLGDVIFLQFSAIAGSASESFAYIGFQPQAGPLTIGGAPGITMAAGTMSPGVAGSVVYGVDATNGYAEVNENNTGLSRLCTTANENTVCVKTVVSTSGSPYSMAGLSGYYWNDASGAYTWQLDAPTAGKQYCFGNYSGQTGAITIKSTTGVYIVYKGSNGTVTTGTLVSGGAAGDFTCLVGVDATHYAVTGAGYGTWTNN